MCRTTNASILQYIGVFVTHLPTIHVSLCSYMRYEGPSLQSRDRAVGLSVIRKLPTSDEDILFLGDDVTDKCRTAGRKPTTPTCRFDEGLELVGIATVVRGAGMEWIKVRRGVGPL